MLINSNVSIISLLYGYSPFGFIHNLNLLFISTVIISFKLPLFWLIPYTKCNGSLSNRSRFSLLNINVYLLSSFYNLCCIVLSFLYSKNHLLLHLITYQVIIRKKK